MDNRAREFYDGVLDRLFVAADLPLRIGMRDQMLAGARFAFHRVTRKRYHDAVQRMELTPEQGEEMYRRAMNNYDDVVAGCAGGAFAEANALQMAKDIATPYQYADLGTADDCPRLIDGEWKA